MVQWALEAYHCSSNLINHHTHESDHFHLILFGWTRGDHQHFDRICVGLPIVGGGNEEMGSCLHKKRGFGNVVVVIEENKKSQIFLCGCFSSTQ